MSHFLSAVRERFLDCFRQSIEKARADLDTMATELLVEWSNKIYPEYCFRLYRTDIIGKQAEKTIVREIAHEAIECLGSKDNLPIKVHIVSAMVWYGIDFRVTGGPPSLGEIIKWSERWLDLEDARFVEGQLFQEVIHNIKPPAATEDGYTVSVDFGTAPTTAFDELIGLLLQNASRVEVGSYLLTQPEPS
jgi:hypothetical protein